MVREVPDYARQYLIEHPEFGPPIDAEQTRERGHPVREAANPQPSSKPKPPQPRKQNPAPGKRKRQNQPRSGERPQPTAQAVEQNQKTIQLRRSERTHRNNL